MRRVLGPLKELCEKTGVTIIALLHPNKRIELSTLQRIPGAAALSAMPRAVWVFFKDEREEGLYHMALGKGNLAAKPKGLLYRIGSKKVPPLPGDFPSIVCKGYSDVSAEDAFAAKDPEVRKADKAEKFLTEHLASGPRSSNEILAEGEKLGLSRRTLWRAKDTLGIKAEKEVSAWCWMFPLAATGAGE